MTDPLRTTIGVALVFLAGALGITLLSAATVFGVPAQDLPKLTLVLAGTGLGGMLVTRSAVLQRFGGVRGQLVGVGLVGNLLLLGMVLAGAAAMFISLHDLSILLAMFLFTSLLAVSFSLRGAARAARRAHEAGDRAAGKRRTPYGGTG